MSLPGKLLLHLYHRPVGLVRDSIRHGGPLAQWETARGRTEMQGAAHLMRELPEFATGAAMVVHVMTGRKFWYQTVFCLHSLARKSQCTLYAEVYDDGTIDDEALRALRRLGPRIRIHRAADLERKLDEVLPVSRFPVLRDRWTHYPNIRKLIAAHVGRQDWKMILDSDLLFFRNPYVVTQWFSTPEGAIHALDCVESYGYSRPLLEKLAGAPVPERVNAGIWAVKSEALNWEEIESWCAELIAKEKTNYYLEQAIVAMLMARERNRIVLPPEDYIVFPGRDEVAHPKAAMHHYVAESKRWYFQVGWKHAFP